MSQGVHPAEWIFPAVGMTHTMYNMGMQAADQPGMKVTTPGSKQDRQNDEQAKQDVIRGGIEASQKATLAERANVYAAQNPTRQDLEDQRRRAQVSATRTLAGTRRSASQTLTDVASPLGV